VAPNQTTTEKLEAHWAAGRFLCVGLDPDIRLIPPHLQQGRAVDTIVAFNRTVIEATCDLVAAYKPNMAFFERYGAAGYAALQETLATINDLSPRVTVVLDGKRGDIGNTNNGYVESTFDHLGADATTINPYLGFDAIRPYAQRRDRLMYVLCRTSNEGSSEFQELIIDDEPLFLHVARRVGEVWNTEGSNFGLVVGATSPQELARVREVVPHLPLLIPGVGAQGGDVKSVTRAVSVAGRPNVLVNASRSVLYHSVESAAFPGAIRRAAGELADALYSGLS
jgi:orotidine-5'-phosphate decarboxylase